MSLFFTDKAMCGIIVRRRSKTVMSMPTLSQFQFIHPDAEIRIVPTRLVSGQGLDADTLDRVQVQDAIIACFPSRYDEVVGVIPRIALTAPRKTDTQGSAPGTVSYTHLTLPTIYSV